MNRHAASLFSRTLILSWCLMFAWQGFATAQESLQTWRRRVSKREATIGAET